MTKEWHSRTVHVTPRTLKKGKGVATGRVMAPLDEMKAKPTQKKELFIRVDSMEWLKIVSSRRDAKFILNVEKDMKVDLVASRLGRLAGKLIVALPIFISETEIGYWKEKIADLRKQGIQQFMVAQYGIKEFFEKKDVLYADYPVWALNRWSQKMLLEEGFKGFMYSIFC